MGDQQSLSKALESIQVVGEWFTWLSLNLSIARPLKTRAIGMTL